MKNDLSINLSKKYAIEYCSGIQAGLVSGQEKYSTNLIILGIKIEQLSDRAA
jgi:hypothetical protein